MSPRELRDAEEWLGLGSEYDPGPFVFDYFNEQQLADVAQGLGLSLAQSREVTREERRSGSIKFALKVFEAGGEGGSGRGESETLGGSMPTATLIAILVRLRQALRLHVVSQRDVDGPVGMLAATRAAAFERGWVIIDGDWLVTDDTGDSLSIRLLRPVNGQADLEGALCLDAWIPATRADLTPTGRLRLRTDQRIDASVFGQIHSWDATERRLTVIAHAAFARMGDPRFAWRGVSFGSNSNGDF